MSEPITATHTFNLGSLLISGMFLGMPVDALALGAMAAAVTLGIGEKKAPTRACCEIVLSALVAGALTPLGTAWLATKYLPHMDVEQAFNTTRTITPIIIGSTVQYFYPLATQVLPAYLKRKFGVNDGQNH